MPKSHVRIESKFGLVEKRGDVVQLRPKSGGQVYVTMRELDDMLRALEAFKAELAR